jgi:hypothetical protein
MVANVRGYTPNYGFKLINFDTPRWHTLEYANWSQLDSMFLQFGASGIRGEWLNSTEYLIGERVFDGVNGLIYRCLVQHVSAATGTFAADRTAHPTFWSLQLGGVPVFRGDWSPGSSYSVGDIVVVDEYEYFLCTTANIADPTFPGNGPLWQTIFDATEVVNDATDAAAAAAGSASSAFTSANNAAASAAAADTSAEDAADAAYIASSSQGAFRWNFDINTAMADPGVADIQFNNANWSLATLIAISAQTADPGNPDVSDWVASWDDSTNPGQRGTLYIREASEPQNFVVYNITGALTDNGTWLQVPVQFVTKLGAFTTGDALSVSFSRTGNTGASGAGSGDMLGANNLSDVANFATSRSNLGVGAEDTPAFTQVTVANPPTQPDHVATMGYVDSASSLYISDTPPAGALPGALWWESDAGMLYVYYDDGAGAPQWVQAVAIPSPNLSNYVAKSGDAMTGLLTLSGPPSADLHAATKLYADGKAGEAIVDGRTYARKDLAWSEVPRYTRVAVGGLTLVEVQVPTGAKFARITGMLWSNASPTSCMMQLSVSPGVFKNGATDYSVFGYGHTTPNTALSSVNGQANGAMFLSSNAANGVQAMQFDAFLTLAKPDTARLFNCESRAAVYDGGALVHTAYNNFMTSAATGNALSVLAFRIVSNFAFPSESYINVEWM